LLKHVPAIQVVEVGWEALSVSGAPSLTCGAESLRINSEVELHWHSLSTGLA
jgi:hypothetical protein